MGYAVNKLIKFDLIELTDTQIVILNHLVSYILRNNLESNYLPSELLMMPELYFEPIECIPIEERYPDELKLLNKVLALYAMSDKGD